MSTQYEPVVVVREQQVERTVKQVGWVTKYRVLSTIVRVVVTRLTVVMYTPDGTVEVSRYVVPTRYVETEYALPPITVYVGVVSAEEAAKATQPPVEIQPVPPGRKKTEEKLPVPM